MKTRKVGAIGICAAMALVAASAMPAQAAVTSVSGSLSCPVGQVVWVHVVTYSYAQATFYSGTAKRYADTGGYDHVFNYGTRTVNWKVVSSDIQTATDYCGSNATRPSE